MVERNEKGRQARQYFIECERRAKGQPAVSAQFHIPKTLPEALHLATDESERADKAEAALAIATPKAQALDRISVSNEAVTVTQASKLLGLKRETLTTQEHTRLAVSPERFVGYLQKNIIYFYNKL